MKTRLLSVLAFIAILFASCSSDDNDSSQTNDGRVLFSSGINAATPKVWGGDPGDMWNQNDPIGIYMVDHGTTIVADNAENIEYKATTVSSDYKNATFTPTDGTQSIFYPMNVDKKVDFIAYHPYNASVSNYVYPVDLTIQDTPTNIDLMVSKISDNGGKGFDKTNALPVDFVFEHQLVKIILTVSKDYGVGDGTVDVKIKGMNRKADFDMISKTFSNESDNDVIIPDRFGNSDSHFEAFLLPVTLLDDSHVIEFTTGGNTYKWTMKDNTEGIASLKASKSYLFNVKLKKSSLKATGSIEAWDREGGMDNKGEAK